MFTNTTFQFDGKKSTDILDKHLLLVNLDTGGKHAPFGTEREINEEYVRNNPIPYFFGIDEKPLYFRVTIAKEDGLELTYEDRIKIVRWLFHDEYKPFMSTDNIDVVFECLLIERPEKILYGNIPRLIELNFRCNAPWAWSPLITTNYDLSDNTTTQIITMTNGSNVEKYNYPEIWIKSLDGGTVSLVNNSDGGRQFTFANLQVNETIYVNNRLKHIETDIPNTYRLKDFIGRNWLRLGYGTNKIGVTGKCLIKTQMKYPISI